MSVALKEWAAAVKALQNGDQAIILRKGGIAEETRQFELKERKFYLFPTYEHQKPHLLKETYRHLVDESMKDHDPTSHQVTITSAAVADSERLVYDAEELLQFMPFHIWTEEFAEERLHWKKKQPLHVIPLRVYRLAKPIVLQMKPEYQGCKSWIHLEIADLSDELLDHPVLSDEQFDHIKTQIMKL